MTEQWIYWTDELKSSYNDLVGKKCANLGELAEIGVNTPPGFALTVQACEHFMEKSGAAEEIRSFVQKYGHDLKDDVEKQSQASYYIRSIIESKKIPSDLEKQIETAYRDLCQKCQVTDLAVAVRSSGAVSMPGQMETFLNVKGSESLLQYIVRVWGSAFTTRALTFRLDNNMAIESAPIGVAVLKMVNAKCAGITLTVLPSTGDTSKILIEANWGLGESVVSGEITPDQFVIDKKSR
ncbi:MAG TPA: PEP/pyruvate-binding domain-containing protein, partial [Desulfohalobiaceae bacterium]|nr:PEP/pyruvate-binding domain-containing protein [Desulfohalobiaceae bacterium]